jgi:hypothetical protein
MPMKGSQHDQTNTLAMAHVKSGDLTSWSIITMRTAEATQTLEISQRLALWNGTCDSQSQG